MEEIRSVNVHPDYESIEIEKWQDFGWNFVSSQDVRTVDNHLESKSDGLYSVTRKEAFIRLVFKRDTKMRHYSDIVMYEKEYNSIIDLVPKTARLLPMIIGCLGLIIALSNIFVTKENPMHLMDILAVISVGLIIYYIARKIYVKSANKLISAQNIENRERRARLRELSRNLID